MLDDVVDFGLVSCGRVLEFISIWMMILGADCLADGRGTHTLKRTSVVPLSACLRSLLIPLD